MTVILDGTPARLGRYHQQLSGVITEQYSQFSKDGCLKNDQLNIMWISMSFVRG